MLVTNDNSLITGMQINVRLEENELDDSIGLISILAKITTLTDDSGIKMDV